MGILKGSGWAGRLKRGGVAAALLWAAVGVSLASAQDQTPPNLVRASVNGDTLTLTFDEDLAPPKDVTLLRYALFIDRPKGGESPNRVFVAGKIVTLTLAAAVAPSATITLSYHPVYTDGRLHDIAGNEVAPFRSHPVNNDAALRPWPSWRVASSPLVTATTVQYAGSEGAFTSVTMADDGTGGDTTASDGVFGALVPVYEDALPQYLFTYTFTLAAATEEEEEVDAGTTPTTLVINELMASNSTILDPQGDADDWIELKNTGTVAIDLSGMYLSDNTSKPLKWQFPAGTTIAAGGYLLVWADDDDGDSPGLHTNFKLSAGGESVVLSDIDARDNAVIDSVEFPAQTTDVSYGRSPEGTGSFQALAAASPGDPTPTVPEIAIIADGPVTEGGTATFTLTATLAPTADLIVNVAVTQGTGDNYLPATLPTSVTITAGATEATLSVAIPDDSTDEPSGVLTVTLEDGTGYTISTTAGSASLTVRDDNANPAASAVVINELMAANDNTMLDPQGDADDWIELKNTSEAVIDLSGMYLSDDRAEPKKWQFPAGTTIAAGGYLLIWADNDDGDSPGLHANFKLSADGESVVLSDTDANGNAIIDAVDFPAQTTDVSYGRSPEGTGSFQALATASPDGPTPTPVAPLTAAFVGMPPEHNGRRLFSFELRFSDDFPGRLPYTLLRDRAFRVTNGTVRQAKRVAPGQNQRWMIAVRPDSFEAVTVTLPATTDCGAAGAVCTEAGRPLSNSVSATVPGLAPLTAAFVGMPAAHDGSSLFRFELRFSDDFRGRLPYTLLRDRAFRVTNGTVHQAKRVAPGQNQRWMIAVRPDSFEAVTVTLPATTDCDAVGAVCTEAGRPLSNSVSATVVSSVKELTFSASASRERWVAPHRSAKFPVGVKELTFSASASRERWVAPHRSAGFPIGVPVAATGPESLAWRIDDPRGLFEIDIETGQLRMAVDGEEVFEILDDGWFHYPRGNSETRFLSIVFTVTVSVSDSFDRTVETQVPIRVTSDTEGDVTLSLYEPKVGTTIAASVSDPDGVLNDSVDWQWEYDDGNWVDDGFDGFVPDWQVVEGATGATFTPSADMAGCALRAVASYADGLSAPGEQDKYAESASTDEIK